MVVVSISLVVEEIIVLVSRFVSTVLVVEVDVTSDNVDKVFVRLVVSVLEVVVRRISEIVKVDGTI